MIKQFSVISGKCYYHRRMQKNLQNIKKIIIFFLPLSFLILSCSTPCDENNKDCVQIPEVNASSPQNVTLIVSEQRDDELVKIIHVDEISALMNFSEPTGNLIVVSISAEDEDGGIKSLKLWVTKERCRTVIEDGKESSVCEGEGLLAGPRAQSVSNATIGEFTLKKRSLVEIIDLDEELGDAYSRMDFNMWVEAENFHNVKTRTQIVTISYP